MTTDVTTVDKAIAGAVVSGLTSLQIALPDGITAYEWISVVIATIIGFGAVYFATNKPTDPTVL